MNRINDRWPMPNSTGGLTESDVRQTLGDELEYRPKVYTSRDVEAAFDAGAQSALRDIKQNWLPLWEADIRRESWANAFVCAAALAVAWGVLVSLGKGW